MKKLLSVFVILATFSTNIFAKSSVWKVEKDGEVAYLAGTIHLLRPNEKIPAEYEKAFNMAEKVFFETDMDAINSPSIQGKMMPMLMYTNGETLQTKLSPEVYKELDAFLASQGIPIAQVNQFKPSMISITLLGLALQRYGYSADGIDAIYHAKASKKGLPIGQLESVDKQLQVVAAMGDGEEDEFIRTTIADMSKAKEVLDKMIEVVKTGNVETLETEFLSQFETMPKYYNTLVKERNDNWMPQVEAMLKTKEKEIILVGALHLVGKDGLIKQLQQKGYKVEQL